MTKFFVKKPYFVLVTVIIVLVIGFVSLGEMQTDLLPKMELPYMAVITTEVGAFLLPFLLQIHYLLSVLPDVFPEMNF